MLEDSSGRIRLRDSTKEQNLMSRIVTGSIIGCLGRADVAGIFHVEDLVYAEYCPSSKLPS